MNRSQATKTLLTVFVGLAMVSCTGNPGTQTTQAEAIVPVVQSNIAPEDQPLSDPAESAVAQEAESSASANSDGQVKPAEQASKSSESTLRKKTAWKKTKNGRSVAADAQAGDDDPAIADEVNLDQAVDAGPQTQMRISQIKSTTSEAQGIGEIAGPATLVEIRLNNKSDSELDLSVAQLRLFYGKQKEPASLLTDDRSAPLPLEIKAGDSITATYLFAAPKKNNKKVLVEFETGATEEIQQLKGEVSR
ncbi:hypothetical protein [Glutamicibacter sp. JC586]|uniref:hypothetical protein n=1 Tax=Glutamicibacter sp. JC586 TaxID=2590552 RepID=UPI00135A3D31|nr:hypothetical protein [Glutamicibacter sp. JC586]